MELFYKAFRKFCSGTFNYQVNASKMIYGFYNIVRFLKINKCRDPIFRWMILSAFSSLYKPNIYKVSPGNIYFFSYFRNTYSTIQKVTY